MQHPSDRLLLFDRLFGFLRLKLGHKVGGFERFAILGAVTVGNGAGNNSSTQIIPFLAPRMDRIKRHPLTQLTTADPIQQLIDRAPQRQR